MQSYPPSRIRNVALAGHHGVGKTTLVEALLHAARVLAKPGRVEDGTTVCDFEPEEVEHRFSVQLATAPVPVGEVLLNLVDTPGTADFSGELRAALGVCDLVAVVVSAVDGVEAQAEAAWELAAELGLPRLVVVNKLDRDQASFDRVLAALRERFGAGLAPLELPVGEAEGFRGVVDLLADQAVLYQDGRPVTGPVPEEVADLEHQVREQLVEGIVVGDDGLMERYLEGEVPTAAELEAALAGGVHQALVFPVVCCSATTGVGVDRLASLLAELAPSPDQRAPYRVQAGDTVQEVACDPTADPLAFVFKTFSDPYVGHVSLLRVVSGTIRPDMTLTNPRTHAEVRLHGLQRLRGKQAEPIPEAQAGDLFAVTKLTEVTTGDTLAPKGTPVRVLPLLAPEPAVHAMAVVPQSRADEDKLMTALHRLQEEDPSLVVERSDESRQTVLRGAGETHLALACERLKRKFGVTVSLEPVAVPYRETITQEAQAEGKYKKQTGGHGQFGVCVLRLRPLPRGEGFRFVDEVVGGAIPKQYIPAVEKGVQEAFASGGPHGFPVVDVEVTCLDGKYHPVDSSEMSFKMAGALAVREALAKAGAIVLEPVERVTVEVPSALQGDVLGDLNGRRGRVLGTEALPGDRQRIEALVPSAELQRYAPELRSLTGGRGRFRAVFDHYEPLPGPLQDKVHGVPDRVPAGRA
ncbi:elongation factor G [Aciditerrimonas ferrireducens]|uniref:Elongation factor G n=1 Tax=Aciditerrimonas ferrireducens TaxID=667306 RepID=A0ABV6C434_9ACTN|nr:elongation factor G [Aciditerrimonas ferrireducens]MCK4177223.1 elongation factor G [Aciditerrimonas ferrireducens]